LKCWDCGEPHYFKDCPNKKKGFGNVHLIQEATTIGEITRSIPQISAALENRQAEYQTSMVEVEGTLKQIPISILIDPGASLKKRIHFHSRRIQRRLIDTEDGVN